MDDEKKDLKYIVVYNKPSSQEGLEEWINHVCKTYNLRLVAVDNGFYIFEDLGDPQ